MGATQPDLVLCAHAHSPAKAGEEPGEATDKAGWEAYGNDWRHYFDCMLAPVAQQAAGKHLQLPTVLFKALWCLYMHAEPSPKCMCMLPAILKASLVHMEYNWHVQGSTGHCHTYIRDMRVKPA